MTPFGPCHGRCLVLIVVWALCGAPSAQAPCSGPDAPFWPPPGGTQPPEYLAGLPSKAVVGPAGRVNPELPPCTAPFDVGLGKWVPFEGPSPIKWLDVWYQPPNCSLRAIPRDAARACLANKSVLFNGASLTRNQFTALTGFLLDDHTWDLNGHRSMTCSACFHAHFPAFFLM